MMDTLNKLPTIRVMAARSRKIKGMNPVNCGLRFAFDEYYAALLAKCEAEHRYDKALRGYNNACARHGI
jgi:hypothetical protein